MNLSDLGEFGFLDRMRQWVPGGSALVGIGDDAAVVKLGDTTVVATTDALVEGNHFRLDWSSPADVGWKAVSVNVSDVAAMGAQPRFVLLALSAPANTSEEVLRGIYAGIAEACATYGIELVGGDVVRADELQLAVTAIGELDGDPLRRSGAKAGDVLAVTGPLGRAACGANLLMSQDPNKITPEDAIACMDAHRRPRARVAEGIALQRGGAHAAIDISDGLARDAGHLADASGVRIEIDRVPIAAEVVRIAEARGWDGIQIALGGGEDFELLVALPDAGDLIEIGRVVEGEGVTLDDEPLLPTGWDHFRT